MCKARFCSITDGIASCKRLKSKEDHIIIADKGQIIKGELQRSSLSKMVNYSETYSEILNFKNKLALKTN